MSEVKPFKILSFSSEDDMYPATNMLKGSSLYQWRCKVPSESEAFVEFQFKSFIKFTRIEIGNNCSAFIEIQVSNSRNPKNYEILIGLTSLLSPAEAMKYENLNRVRFFKEINFSKSIGCGKWDIVRIICTQPFNKLLQYGLSFIKFYYQEDNIHNAKDKVNSEKFTIDVENLMESQNDENVACWQPGYLFTQRKKINDHMDGATSSNLHLKTINSSFVYSKPSNSNDVRSNHIKLENEEGKEKNKTSIQKCDSVKDLTKVSKASSDDVRSNHIKLENEEDKEENKTSKQKFNTVIDLTKVSKASSDDVRSNNIKLENEEEKEENKTSKQKFNTVIDLTTDSKASSDNVKSDCNKLQNEKEKEKNKTNIQKFNAVKVLTTDSKTTSDDVNQISKNQSENIRKQTEDPLDKNDVLKIKKRRIDEKKDYPKQDLPKSSINIETNSSNRFQKYNQGDSSSVIAGTSATSTGNLSTNSIFSNVIFLLSGFQNPLRNTIRQKALSLGAQYRTSWSDDCTHLICAYHNTPKFKEICGKGIIVSEKWVLDCFNKKKLLPWRDYRLKGALSPIKRIDKNPTEETTGINLPVISAVFSTDNIDDPLQAEKEVNLLPYLPDIYLQQHFFFFGDFDADELLLLQRFIITFGGVVHDYMSSEVRFVITNSTWDHNFDEGLQSNPNLRFVKSQWIYECDEKCSLVPIDEFEIVK